MGKPEQAREKVPLTTLIYSFYALHVLPREPEVAISTIVKAMAALGISPRTTRVTVSRLQQDGFLQSRRQGRNSFYFLTPEGMQDVGWGSRRAYEPDELPWDGRWTVVSYSIPEPQRQLRGRLRQSLKWWGFGAIAPGVWISPGRLSPDAEEKLRAMGAWEYVDVFRGEYQGPHDQKALVARAWPQLKELAGRYQGFIDHYRLVLDRFATGQVEPEAAFAAKQLSVCEFVAISLDDPALPPPLLPTDWPRPAAQELSSSLLQTLDEPAWLFFDGIRPLEEKGATDG